MAVININLTIAEVLKLGRRLNLEELLELMQDEGKVKVKEKFLKSLAPDA